MASGFAPLPPIRARSAVAGIAGTTSMLVVYVGIITLAQGVDHALEQLATDALFIALLVVGFGTQVALFVELRAVDRQHRTAVAVSAAATGTSATAMLACCAHHLVDLLPLVGLSAASVVLTTYRTPLFVIAIAMNVIGILLIARRLAAAREACAMAGAPSPA
jgi:hypothetical protein